MKKTKMKPAKAARSVRPVPAREGHGQMAFFLAFAFAALSLFFAGLAAVAPSIALAAK